MKLDCKHWRTWHVFFQSFSSHAVFLFEGPSESCWFGAYVGWTDLFHAGIVFLFQANIEKPFPELAALQKSRGHRGQVNLVKYTFADKNKGRRTQVQKSHLQKLCKSFFALDKQQQQGRTVVAVLLARGDFVNEHPVLSSAGREHRAVIVAVWE